MAEKYGREYVYFGTEQQLQLLLNNRDSENGSENCIKLEVNLDGLPPFKYCSTQFWSILCCTDLLPPFLVTHFVETKT